MCNKNTDEKIGKIVRGALGEIVDLMAEETHKKLLGLPRYQKCVLDDGPGRPYKYGIDYVTSENPCDHRDTVAIFDDEKICDRVVILLNREISRGA